MIFKIQKRFLFSSLCLFILFKQSFQDIYLHNPRGSNNRLNETTANRKNNNRLFDSENNNQGGYNIGDATSKPSTNEEEQYQMKYFQSGLNGGDSILEIEWTNQHGCGGNGGSDQINKNCMQILQYMCTPDFTDLNDPDRLRDGLSTKSQDYVIMGSSRVAESIEKKVSRKNISVNFFSGLHETWEYYDSCRYRQSNGGLFLADQQLKKNEIGYSSAIHTRQNPNGGRSGYECPEERDYYPYWHPTNWKDIAVFTSNVSMCDYFKRESFNTKPKGLCVEFYPDAAKTPKHWSRWNNPKDCAAKNGTWTEFYNYLEKAPQFTNQSSCEANKGYKWAIPYGTANALQKECLVLLEPPACDQAEWTRQNHLGNTKTGQTSLYRWKLPNFPSKKMQKCVFRIRYNITSNEYDWNTDSASNGNQSPIKDDPIIKIGPQSLKLAIDTTQTGRVFQDRSHTFYLLARPTDISETARVHNLNVRGKRGNIVQTFPAVEYDFVPSILRANVNDFVHVQWTGSNTHNNIGEGDAGQGQTGTDRHNFVMTDDLNKLVPLQFEQSSFWQDIQFVGYLNKFLIKNDTSSYIKKLTISSNLKQDLALYLSSSSYYECISNSTCTESFEAKPVLDSDMNNAPASLPGALFRFTKSICPCGNSIYATYMFMCSRNNAFSNRNQIGQFIVV